MVPILRNEMFFFSLFTFIKFDLNATEKIGRPIYRFISEWKRMDFCIRWTDLLSLISFLFTFSLCIMNGNLAEFPIESNRRAKENNERERNQKNKNPIDSHANKEDAVRHA